MDISSGFKCHGGRNMGGRNVGVRKIKAPLILSHSGLSQLHVLVVMFWLSSPLFLVQADVMRLTCLINQAVFSSCPVMVILSRLSCIDYPIPTVLPCPILAIMSSLTCHYCCPNCSLQLSRPTVQSWMPCPSCPVPAVMGCPFVKGEHPQFKSAPPQLRNIADNQIDCGVAD